MKGVMQQIVAKIALCILAHSDPADAAKIHQDVNSDTFMIMPGTRCVGTPYTEQTNISCNGWFSQTIDECRLKCLNSETAPNCPIGTCVAANFYPASGTCHLFDVCNEVEEDVFSSAIVSQAVVEALPSETEEVDFFAEYGPYSELAVALPVVLINLTNYSGLIGNNDTSHSEVSHTFGDLESDLELLYDNVQGFFIILHESMNSTDGPKYCPMRDESYIMDCINVAACLIQSTVGQYVPIESFTLIMELLTRFETITWPLLKGALSIEDPESNVLRTDHPVPSIWVCDDTEEHEKYDSAVVASGLLQLDGSQRSLAMSAALSHATRGALQVLDSHGLNSSMDLTIQHLEELWQPLCQELSCDHTNYWDIFLASHAQTLTLMQTGAAMKVRSEIQQRQQLQMRVQHFMMQHGTGSFFMSDDRKAASETTFQLYGQHGRDALLAFSESFMHAWADEDEDKATRMFDRHRFAAFASKQEESEGATRALLSSRARTGKGMLKKAGKSVKKKASKAAKKTGKVVKKGATVVAKFVVSLFACTGRASNWYAAGYTRMFGTHAGFNFGFAGGISSTIVRDLVQGKAASLPSGWFGVYASLGFGNTHKHFWGGMVASAFLSISKAGGYFTVTVGAVAAAWNYLQTKKANLACPAGHYFGNCPMQHLTETPPYYGCYICMQSFGVTISLMCCDVNVMTGDSTCR